MHLRKQIIIAKYTEIHIFKKNTQLLASWAIDLIILPFIIIIIIIVVVISVSLFDI